MGTTHIIPLKDKSSVDQSVFLLFEVAVGRYANERIWCNVKWIYKTEARAN